MSFLFSYNFRYPFDIQFCPIKLSIPTSHMNLFVMKWNDWPYLHKIKTTEFEVLDNLMYNNTNSTQNEIIIYIKLRRKLSYHIFNTYVPSFCLAMIAGFTLFIDESHFEATIMVALTSMLVIYTLHQSILTNLPHTSYMKMVDVWLFGGLIIPFVIISILVILDYLIIKESNEVTKLGKSTKWNSKMFLKCMQITLPIAAGILCTIYWIYGLTHYYYFSTGLSQELAFSGTWC